jgi:hypothetical protein
LTGYGHLGNKTLPCGCTVFAFNHLSPCEGHESYEQAARARGLAYGRMHSQFSHKHDRMPIGWENAALLAAADGDLTFPEFRTVRELRDK